MSQVTTFWSEELRPYVFAKTGQNSFFIRTIAANNKFVKKINNIVGGNFKTKVLNLVIEKDQISIELISQISEDKKQVEYNLLSLTTLPGKSFLNVETKAYPNRMSVKTRIAEKGLAPSLKKKYFLKAFADLSKTVGGEAAKKLLSGKANLRIWRNSTPHNWWIEDQKGNTLWHSEQGKPKPALSSFQTIGESADTVSYGGSFLCRGRDEGMPQQSDYALCQPLVKAVSGL